MGYVKVTPTEEVYKLLEDILESIKVKPDIKHLRTFVSKSCWRGFNANWDGITSYMKGFPHHTAYQFMGELYFDEKDYIKQLKEITIMLRQGRDLLLTPAQCGALEKIGVGIR